jgi:CheY-like chemotaxis protein
LAFFTASRGTRRALAAGPNTEACRDVAELLAASGVEVDTATSGRELFRLASTSPDYELAFIDVAIDAPTADLLMQQLRRDCRTADLRAGLLAQAGFFEQAGRIAQRYARTLDFARPRDEKGFQWQIAQLAALSPQDFVGYEERQRQAAQALDLLAELSSTGDDGLYDLRCTQDAVLTALYNPQLSTKAIAVLENLGTPASQRALVEMASRFTQPLELRKAAAAALRKNIEEHGILLTTVEIRRQYDRYNQSATLDADTQQVLGAVLDSIEAPTQAVKKRD